MNAVLQKTSSITMDDDEAADRLLKEAEELMINLSPPDLDLSIKRPPVSSNKK